MTSAAPVGETASFRWAGYLLGLASGGFFDGILLHQILQWHHFLSGLEGHQYRTFQVLADGVFHGAMYVAAAAGLWLLWRPRGDGGRRLFLANLLIGFGAWHVFDAVLAHWILGLHRIRMDTEHPLVWDIIWFVMFGVLFLAAGLRLRRMDRET